MRDRDFWVAVQTGRRQILVSRRATWKNQNSCRVWQQTPRGMPTTRERSEVQIYFWKSIGPWFCLKKKKKKRIKPHVFIWKTETTWFPGMCFDGPIIGRPHILPRLCGTKKFSVSLWKTCFRRPVYSLTWLCFYQISRDTQVYPFILVCAVPLLDNHASIFYIIHIFVKFWTDCVCALTSFYIYCNR